MEIPSPSNKPIDPSISFRCGKGTCPFYDKHNKVSGCKVYDSRQKCSLSNKQRKKSASYSRNNQRINWYG